MRDVERGYWELVKARREVVIQSELVKQTEETLGYLEPRAVYDAYEALLCDDVPEELTQWGLESTRSTSCSF